MLLAGKAVVLVSMLGPLVVVTNGVAARVAGLAVITVPAVDDVVLSSDEEALRAAFGDRAWHHPALNPERFSAAELWFVTV